MDTSWLIENADLLVMGVWVATVAAGWVVWRLTR